MSQITVAYWSGTGNTEIMARPSAKESRLREEKPGWSPWKTWARKN